MCVKFVTLGRFVHSLVTDYLLISTLLLEQPKMLQLLRYLVLCNGGLFEVSSLVMIKKGTFFCYIKYVLFRNAVEYVLFGRSFHFATSNEQEQARFRRHSFIESTGTTASTLSVTCILPLLLLKS